MADALKAEGNKLFAAKDFQGAIEKWSQAIELDSENHVLYSNRSGAYASIKDWEHALQDAEKTTQLKPDWPKGWNRKGAALHGAMRDLDGASKAYEQALKLDPVNAQAKGGKAEIERLIQQRASFEEQGATRQIDQMIASKLKDPNLLNILAQDPKTSAHLADRGFMTQLEELQKSPSLNSLSAAAQKNPKFNDVFAAVFAIGVEEQESGADAEPPNEDVPMPDARSTSNRPPKQKEPAPEPEPEPEDEETIAKKKAQADAEEQKKLGTENYKKRQFDAAIQHYSKAWELHKDITYLTNLGAANFEKGDYDAAIEACQKAVEEGREILADFKLIAKAFGRIGSAYEKKGDLANAILNYDKSLMEHRTPDILTKLRAAQKAQIKAEKDAYLDPQKAEEAREAGNQKFKECDWPAAVELYSEMIKRAPEDPRGYSNRAACFIKLLSFPSAVQDCDFAIEKDPKFIRAYIRKGQALLAMREYNKCKDVCQEALAQDEGGKNAREITGLHQQAEYAELQARSQETKEQAEERIKKDPEIQGLLQDQTIQFIIQQTRGNHEARNAHMKDPVVGPKLRKIWNAGLRW